MATPAQTSANSTAWSLKKLPTISVLPPYKVSAECPRRGQVSITSGLSLGGVGVRELQVRRDLLEVAHELVRDRALEHRHEHPERLDRQPSLLQVAIVFGE